MKSEYSYNIRLNFSEGAREPSRLFFSMGKMIESSRKIDIMLASCINREIKSEQILEHIETGSIFTVIKEKFEYPDNQELGEIDTEKAKEFIRTGKKGIIAHIKENPVIDNNEKMDNFKDKISEIVKETEVNQSFSYTPPDTRSLINGIESILSAIESLTDGENFTINVGDSDEIEVPKEIHLDTEKIEESLVETKLSNEMDVILKIKNRIFLGIQSGISNEEKHPFRPKYLMRTGCDNSMRKE